MHTRVEYIIGRDQSGPKDSSSPPCQRQIQIQIQIQIRIQIQVILIYNVLMSLPCCQPQLTRADARLTCSPTNFPPLIVTVSLIHSPPPPQTPPTTPTNPQTAHSPLSTSCRPILSIFFHLSPCFNFSFFSYSRWEK